MAGILVWIHFRDVESSAADLLKTFEQTPTQRYLSPAKAASTLCNNTDANTAFAVASLLVVNGFEQDQYLQGMCKLGHAIKQFARIDCVLLVLENGIKLSSDEQATIAHCGWKVCFVTAIPGPPLPGYYTNRFLEAKLYTKLRMWELVQYKAVLYIDLDTLIVRQFAGVFQEHLPRMTAAGLTLGMGYNRYPDGPDFNAGVMLLVPDLVQFESLTAGIGSTQHDVELAEQPYLNAFFAERIYRLPFAYNAMVSERPVIPTPWHDSEVIILHYTCKPWHIYNCWRDRIEDLCSLWHMARW